MKSLNVLKGDHAGTGRHVFQKRHLTTNLAGSNLGRRGLGRNLNARGPFQKKIDPSDFLPF